MRRALDEDLTRGEFARERSNIQSCDLSRGESSQARSSRASPTGAYPQSASGGQSVDSQQAIITDAFAQMAKSNTLLAQTMAAHIQSRPGSSNRREADTIKIPSLPKPTDLRSWEGQVLQAVMAASGLDNQSEVSDWIYECSVDTEDPDSKFDPESCPSAFASLDTKLGVAVYSAIVASGSPPLRNAIDRLRSKRQLERKPPWGGRRLLYEVRKFLNLTEEGEDRRAIHKLECLTWHGDDLSKVEGWYNEALLACQGAARAGLKNRVIVDKLRECFEKSLQFRSTLESWLEIEKRSGKAEWHDLMSVFEERLTTRRTRLAEAEADAQRVKRPSTAAGTEEGGHPPPTPQGPPGGTATKTKAQRICEKFANVCRNHVLHGRCRNGSSCPRDHTALKPHDLNALWDAAKELYPSEFRDRGADSPANGQGGKETICKHLKSHAGCTWGDSCQWLHNWSAAEQARVQKVRAARLGVDSPRSQPAGGVHAQAHDPDGAWSGWPLGDFVPQR